MNNKINESLEMYTKRLNRKQKQYHELELLKESEDLNRKQEIDFEKLHTEISLLTSFIRELEYMLED